MNADNDKADNDKAEPRKSQTAGSGALDPGPWNPGIKSVIPQDLMPFVTLYRPENARRNYAEAKELSTLFGLPIEDLAVFTAERLIIHELLVRVTADLSVPDGPTYEVLGINLRRMVDVIYRRHARAELAAFESLLETLRADARAIIDARLQPLFTKAAQPAPEKRSLFNRIFSKPAIRPDAAPAMTPEQKAFAAIREWQSASEAATDPLTKTTLAILSKVAGAMLGQRGRLIPDQNLIAEVAVGMVGNSHGASLIGSALVPIIERAICTEGYRALPVQAKPLVMNVKGASAAGKSTIRTQQSLLAARIGVAWEDFALISPDYWRKYLIDYDSLGENYKYAAMLTGRELEIIDRKLDRYMAEKAAKGTLSHLLIDRFRFDSFAPQQIKEADSNLLTRFGDTVYLFFMITPPEATVERAWARGLTTGRYKAVDDLLYHNIEAYTGMPQLFFAWALSTRKKVHYEFLDNSVAKGERPRTIAFGWNGEMTILDSAAMAGIERFKHINVEARRPEEVYRNVDASGTSEPFLAQCARLIPSISLAEFATGRAYALIERGTCSWFDAQKRALAEESLAAFGIRLPPAEISNEDGDPPPVTAPIDEERRHTVGTWAIDAAS